jgi:hypothetical protein
MFKPKLSMLCSCNKVGEPILEKKNMTRFRVLYSRTIIWIWILTWLPHGIPTWLSEPGILRMQDAQSSRFVL